jgi:hypothetical protein
MSSPKFPVLEALGSVSGLGRPAMDSILADVQANLAKLNACPRHDFVGIQETALRQTKDGGWVFRDYRCSNCSGKVDSHAEHWYRRGIEHAEGGAK